jgi:hypothetical protein
MQHGGGDVDGEEVEHVHEHAGQDGGEDEPRAMTGPRARRGGDGCRLRLCHVALLVLRGREVVGAARAPHTRAAITW